MPLLLRLLSNPEILERVSSRTFRALTNWMVDNIFSDSIFSVENWLEVAFHLCKQRWDQSIDWLEDQPMSKVKLMISINEKFVEKQKDAAKKPRKK